MNLSLSPIPFFNTLEINPKPTLNLDTFEGIFDNFIYELYNKLFKFDTLNCIKKCLLAQEIETRDAAFTKLFNLFPNISSIPMNAPTATNDNKLPVFKSVPVFDADELGLLLLGAFCEAAYFDRSTAILILKLLVNVGTTLRFYKTYTQLIYLFDSEEHGVSFGSDILNTLRLLWKIDGPVNFFKFGAPLIANSNFEKIVDDKSYTIAMWVNLQEINDNIDSNICSLISDNGQGIQLGLQSTQPYLRPIPDSTSFTKLDYNFTLNNWVLLILVHTAEKEKEIERITVYDVENFEIPEIIRHSSIFDTIKNTLFRSETMSLSKPPLPAGPPPPRPISTTVLERPSLSSRGTVTFYVNGKFYQSFPCLFPKFASIGNSSVTIGGYTGLMGQYYLFHSELNPSQCLELFQAGPRYNASSLVNLTQPVLQSNFSTTNINTVLSINARVHSDDNLLPYRAYNGQCSMDHIKDYNQIILRPDNKCALKALGGLPYLLLSLSPYFYGRNISCSEELCQFIQLCSDLCFHDVEFQNELFAQHGCSVLRALIVDPASIDIRTIYFVDSIEQMAISLIANETSKLKLFSQYFICEFLLDWNLWITLPLDVSLSVVNVIKKLVLSYSEIICPILSLDILLDGIALLTAKVPGCATLLNALCEVIHILCSTTLLKQFQIPPSLPQLSKLFFLLNMAREDSNERDNVLEYVNIWLSLASVFPARICAFMHNDGDIRFILPLFRHENENVRIGALKLIGLYISPKFLPLKVDFGESMNDFVVGVSNTILKPLSGFHLSRRFYQALFEVILDEITLIPFYTTTCVHDIVIDDSKLIVHASFIATLLTLTANLSFKLDELKLQEKILVDLLLLCQVNIENTSVFLNNVTWPLLLAPFLNILNNNETIDPSDEMLNQALKLQSDHRENATHGHGNDKKMAALLVFGDHSNDISDEFVPNIKPAPREKEIRVVVDLETEVAMLEIRTQFTISLSQFLICHSLLSLNNNNSWVHLDNLLWFWKSYHGLDVHPIHVSILLSILSRLLRESTDGNQNIAPTLQLAESLIFLSPNSFLGQFERHAYNPYENIDVEKDPTYLFPEARLFLKHVEHRRKPTEDEIALCERLLSAASLHLSSIENRQDLIRLLFRYLLIVLPHPHVPTKISNSIISFTINMFSSKLTDRSERNFGLVKLSLYALYSATFHIQRSLSILNERKNYAFPKGLVSELERNQSIVNFYKNLCRTITDTESLLINVRQAMVQIYMSWAPDDENAVLLFGKNVRELLCNTAALSVLRRMNNQNENVLYLLANLKLETNDLQILDLLYTHENKFREMSMERARQVDDLMISSMEKKSIFDANKEKSFMKHITTKKVASISLLESMQNYFSRDRLIQNKKQSELARIHNAIRSFKTALQHFELRYPSINKVPIYEVALQRLESNASSLQFYDFEKILEPLSENTLKKVYFKLERSESALRMRRLFTRCFRDCSHDNKQYNFRDRKNIDVQALSRAISKATSDITTEHAIEDKIFDNNTILELELEEENENGDRDFLYTPHANKSPTGSLDENPFSTPGASDGPARRCSNDTMSPIHRASSLSEYMVKPNTISESSDPKKNDIYDVTIVTPTRELIGKLSISHLGRFLLFEGSNFNKAQKSYKWLIKDLVQILPRRYLTKPVALEIFLANYINYFFVFTNDLARNILYNALCKNSNGIPFELYPKRRIMYSGLTEKWLNRQISNFEYLQHLNTIAGRSYNDLTQYPVFPWVLNDYTSNSIRLECPEVFRDLSKPIGALNKERLKQFIERYNESPHDVIGMPPFLYGSHYSSAGIVLQYLLRIEPFTTLALEFQDGRFDAPDRMFHSIAESYNSALHTFSDVRELTPEFYYMPEFLTNMNNVNFGKRQNGEDVSNVVLPPWASTPEDFIRVQREALESEYVSMHLNEWIDLIFGFNQRGPNAVSSHNLFFHLSYEGAVNLDDLDENTKISYMAQIKHFGLTPSQLFSKPHPRRSPRTIIPRNLSLPKFSIGGGLALPISWPQNYSGITVYSYQCLANDLKTVSISIRPVREKDEIKYFLFITEVTDAITLTTINITDMVASHARNICQLSQLPVLPFGIIPPSEDSVPLASAVTNSKTESSRNFAKEVDDVFFNASDDSSLKDSFISRAQSLTKVPFRPTINRSTSNSNSPISSDTFVRIFNPINVGRISELVSEYDFIFPLPKRYDILCSHWLDKDQVPCWITTPNGRYILAGGFHDGSIKIFSTCSPFTVSSVVGHSSPITCIAFSSDRLNVVSGASDGSVALWNTPNSFTALETVPISTPNIIFFAHPSAVVAVAHHVGLGVIISVSNDGYSSIFAIYSFRRKRPTRLFRIPSTTSTFPGSLSISEGLKVINILISSLGYLIVLGQRKSNEFVLLLLTINGKLLRETRIKSYNDTPSRSVFLCLSKKGDFLFQSINNMLYVRDVFSLQLITTFPHFETDILSLDLSLDERYITAVRPEHIHIYPLPYYITP